MKFTFKTKKPTGKWASFYSPSHYIKLKGHEVGSIDHRYPFEIRLAVIKKNINEDGNANCTWKWITLMKHSDSLDEAKLWLNEHIESLLNRYNLRLL